MSLLDRAFVTLDCPNCGYGMDVEFRSVRLEATVFCPCCKVSIHLTDEGASVYGAQKEMDLALKSVESEMEELGKVIGFGV